MVWRIFLFYRDGFRAMTLGRTLWKIIVIKVVIIFTFLKIFFFQGFLEKKFATDPERAAYVLEQLTSLSGELRIPREISPEPGQSEE